MARLKSYGRLAVVPAPVTGYNPVFDVILFVYRRFGKRGQDARRCPVYAQFVAGVKRGIKYAGRIAVKTEYDHIAADITANLTKAHKVFELILRSTSSFYFSIAYKMKNSIYIYRVVINIY